MTQQPRGVALIFAMITLTVIAILAMLLSTLTISSNTSLMNHEDREQALLLAEAGVAQGVSAMNMANRNGTLGTLVGNGSPIPLSTYPVEYPTGGATPTGEIYVKITNNLDNTYTVTAVGVILNRQQVAGPGGTIMPGDSAPLPATINNVWRKVEATFQRPVTGGSYPAGAFGKLSLFAHGGIYTNSYVYNPSVSYAQQVASAPAIAALYDAQGNLVHPAYAAGTLDAYNWSLDMGGNVGSNGPVSTVGALVI